MAQDQGNPFDQFDEPAQAANPFDQFDAPEPAAPGLMARAGDAIRGALSTTAQEGITRGISARRIALENGTNAQAAAAPNPMLERLVEARLGRDPMATLRNDGFVAASAESLSNDKLRRQRALSQDTGTIGPVSDEQQIQMDRAKENLLSRAFHNAKDTLGSQVGAAAQIGNELLGRDEQAGDAAIAAAGLRGRVSGAKQRVEGDRLLQDLARVRPQSAATALKRVSGDFIETGLEQLMQNAPAYGAGALGGFGLASVAMGVQTGADSASQYLERNPTAGLHAALSYGSAMGALEGLGEALGLRAELAAFKAANTISDPAKLARKFLLAHGIDQGSEIATTLGQDFVDKFAPGGAKPNMTFGDLLSDLQETVYQTAAMGAVSGAAGRVVHHAGKAIGATAQDRATQTMATAMQAWQSRGLSPSTNGIAPPQPVSHDGATNGRAQTEAIARYAGSSEPGLADRDGSAGGGVPAAVAGSGAGAGDSLRASQVGDGRERADDALPPADERDDSLTTAQAEEDFTGLADPVRKRVAEIEQRSAEIEGVAAAMPEGPNRMILEAERTVLDMERHDLLTKPQAAPGSKDHQEPQAAPALDSEPTAPESVALDQEAAAPNIAPNIAADAPPSLPAAGTPTAPPAQVGGTPTLDSAPALAALPMDQLLPLAKGGDEQAATELKRRETEYLWMRRELQKDEETRKIRTDALAQQAEAAPAVASAAGFDDPAPTAMAAAFSRAKRAPQKSAGEQASTPQVPASATLPQQTATPQQKAPKMGTPPSERFTSHAESLQSMAQDAGWAEEGGKLLRLPDGTTSRTKWVPRAEWFRAGMLGDANQVRAAIGKAARGEFLNAKERRTLDGMMEYLDSKQQGTPLDEDSSAADFERLGYDDLAPAAQEVFSEADDFDALGSRMSPAEAMAALGFTEDEINAETKSAEPVAAGTGTTGSASREDSEAVAGGQKASRESDLETTGTQGEASDGREVKVGPTASDPNAAYKAKQDEKKAAEKSAPLLDTYTAEDLRKREDAASAAAEEEAKKAKAADDKARADAERDTFTLTGSDRAADVAMAHGQGGLFDATAPTVKESLQDQKAAREPDAAYTANESGSKNETQQSLFGDSVPVDAGINPYATAAGRPARARNVDAASGVPGDYGTYTKPYSETKRTLGVATVTAPQHAAQAMAYLARNAVERFDALVTDEHGKPLAIVGAFKGARSQAAVYPSTLMGEAFSIKGAARVWFAHNHPSGKPDLSKADLTLLDAIQNVFRGSSIEPMGMIAIGGAVDGSAPFRYEAPNGPGSTVESGVVSLQPRAARVPVVERVFAERRKLGPEIGSPADAKGAARAISAGRTGLLLLDAQNAPTAFVPWAPAGSAKLRDTGRLDQLARAIGMASPSAAIIVDQGGQWADAQIANIANALRAMDVSVLDVIDPARGGATAAERGGELGRGSAFLSRAGDGAPDARALHAFDDHDGWRENLDVALRQVRSASEAQHYEIHAESNGVAQRVGFLVMSGDELRNIQIAEESQGRGIGEGVVRALLASMPEGATLKVARIERPAVGFWKKLGTKFDNISSDPAVDMYGRLTWDDYENARPEQAANLPASGRYDADAARRGGQDDRRLGEEGGGEGGEDQGRLDRAAEGAAGGVSGRDLRAAVAPLVEGARNLPTIHYLDAPRDAPREVQKWLRENGAFFDAKGLAWGDADIYLFGRSIRDTEDARATALHELTHYGLAGVFGRDLDAVLLRMDESNPRLRAAANAKRKEYPTLSRSQAINEALADMAGRGEAAKLSGFKKLIAVIRDWLRRKGFVREFSDNDVLQIIARSADYWRRERKSEYGAVLRSGPMLATDGGTRSIDAAQLEEMARPIRQAATFDEARAAAKAFQGTELHNPIGLTATVSRNNLDKMLSAKAVGKSETTAEHALAVANLDRLFETAQYGWRKDDRGADVNLRGIHRLFAPMLTDHGMRLVKLTVKEFARQDQGGKIYTVESLAVEKESPASMLVDSTVRADGLDPTSTGHAGHVVSLAQSIGAYNERRASRPEEDSAATAETVSADAGRDRIAEAGSQGVAGVHAEESPSVDSEGPPRGMLSRAEQDNQIAEPQASPESALQRFKRVRDDTIRRLDNAVDGLSGLPNAEAYLDERNLTLGRIAAADEFAKRVRAVFRKMDDATSKQVYDYLTTAGAKPAAITELAARDMAEQVKQRINQISANLVERGMIAAESAAKYHDQYLPRIYLKYILDDSQFGRQFGAGKKPSEQGYRKERKNIPAEIRELVLGEIKDPNFLSVTAIVRPMRDMALLDWLAKISQNADWIYPHQVFTFKGASVTTAWLQSEANRIERQLEHYDAQNKVRAQLLVTQLRGAAQQAQQAQQLSEVDVSEFRQIPDTPRYGVMRGLMVRRQVFEDIMGVGHLTPEHMTWAESLLSFGGVGTKITQVWKSSKVAMNIPGQVRNFVSNMVMLNLSGVPLYRLPDLMVDAIRSIRTDGEHWQTAKRYGVTEATFAAQELYRAEQDMLELKARKGGALDKTAAIASRLYQVVGDFYQLQEAIGKTMKITYETQQGKSPAEAAREAQKWLFDYSLVPRSVRFLRNSPVGAPFLTYQIKVLPRLLEVATTAPWRFLPYAAMFYGLAAAAAEAFDVDDDELDKLKRLMGDWIQKKGHTAVLPWRDADGRVQMIDLSAFFPWTFHTDFGGALARGDVSGAVQQVAGMFSSPILGAAASALGNQDSFTKREIAPRGAPVEDKIAAYVNFGYDWIAPGFLSSKGFISPAGLYDPEYGGKIVKALRGTTNKYGDPLVTPGQAVASLFGVNAYGVDPVTARAQLLEKEKGKISDTASLMRRQLRDAANRRDPEAAKKIREKYKEEATRRQRSLAALIRDTGVSNNLYPNSK